VGCSSIANSFSIDLLTIGNPGNPLDTIGQPNRLRSIRLPHRYEISEQMIDKANAQGGLGSRRRIRPPT
jgi:hypothetical protein